MSSSYTSVILRNNFIRRINLPVLRAQKLLLESIKLICKVCLKCIKLFCKICLNVIYFCLKIRNCLINIVVNLLQCIICYPFSILEHKYLSLFSLRQEVSREILDYTNSSNICAIRVL
nr:MAG TPA: hypothetical protein [Caudoviricetes sp.]